MGKKTGTVRRLHDAGMSRLTEPMANKPWATARRIFFVGFAAGAVLASGASYLILEIL